MREGEAVEKHSIPDACHEGIHWVTSASCHTMTNGFAIFSPTGWQQRTFPLSPGGRKSTVLLLSLTFATLMRFTHFISKQRQTEEEKRVWCIAAVSEMYFVSAVWNYIAELLLNLCAGLPKSPASGDGPVLGWTTASRCHDLILVFVMWKWEHIFKGCFLNTVGLLLLCNRAWCLPQPNKDYSDQDFLPSCSTQQLCTIAFHKWLYAKQKSAFSAGVDSLWCDVQTKNCSYTHDTTLSTAEQIYKTWQQVWTGVF